MKKLVKIIKNNILGFVIGAILFGGIGIAVAVQSSITSSDIAYTNSKNANVTSVKQAVDDLYGKLGNSISKATLNNYLSGGMYTFPIVVPTCIDSDYLICKVINQYKGNNVSYGLFYHNGTITGTTAGIDNTTDILDAEDYSFRYAGPNGWINNYVCFRSDAATCSNEYLYRIIGIFTDDGGLTYKAKLIKYDYATATMLGGSGVGDYYGTGTFDATYYKGSLSTSYKYYWNGKNSSSTKSATDGHYNIWQYSQLNTVNLNTNFITYLNNADSKWANMIATTDWVIAGNTYNKIQTQNAKEAYLNEIFNPDTTVNPYIATNYPVSSKIGLMYVSDYGYAISPSYWKTKLNSYNNVVNNNWMYMGGAGEYTITRVSTDSASFGGVLGTIAFTIHKTGFVYDGQVYNSNYTSPIRPVFYLNSNVKVSSGTGTKSKPWRLSV